MVGYLVSDTRKVTTHRFMEMKQRGEKISMLTSYDFTTASIVDAAGIDAILIGDSASKRNGWKRYDSSHHRRSNDLSCKSRGTCGKTSSRRL